MSTWNVFISVIFWWAVVVVLFWPIFDFLMIRLGRLPPVKSCDLETIKQIHAKGFWFKYSAFKRFRAIKKVSFSQAYSEYKSLVGQA